MSPYSHNAASVSKPSTWGAFDDCMYCIENGLRDYAGFVFADDGYVGIDIDHGIDEFGFADKNAMEFIKSANSYTEISKSGRGFHIIVKGTIPFKGRQDGHGWEIYRNGRYFVLTGNTLEGYTSLRDAQEALDDLVDTRFQSSLLQGSVSLDKQRIWQPMWKLPQDGKISIEPRFDKVGNGNRHLSLVSLCGMWWQAGMCEEYLFNVANKANNTYFCPPLDDNEVMQIVKSTMKYKRG